MSKHNFAQLSFSVLVFDDKLELIVFYSIFVLRFILLKGA